MHCLQILEAASQAHFETFGTACCLCVMGSDKGLLLMAAGRFAGCSGGIRCISLAFSVGLRVKLQCSQPYLFCIAAGEVGDCGAAAASSVLGSKASAAKAAETSCSPAAAAASPVSIDSASRYASRAASYCSRDACASP